MYILTTSLNNHPVLVRDSSKKPSGGEEGKRRSKWDQMAPDSAKTISAFGPLKK